MVGRGSKTEKGVYTLLNGDINKLTKIPDTLYNRLEDGVVKLGFFDTKTKKNKYEYKEGAKKMMEHLDIKREDIFSPNDPNVIPEITKRIEAERDDLLEYRQNLKMYNQYRQTLEQANRYDTDITEEMLLFYNPDTGRFEKPKHKYNGRKPAIFIFCDG